MSLKKKQKKVYLLAAPAGSGKSTWISKHYVWDFDSLISRDCIRFNLLKPGDDYFEVEPEVRRQFHADIVECTSPEHWSDNVFIDATHLTKKSRDFVRKYIHKDAYIIAVSVEVPLHVALERNAQRTGRALVPEKVIRNMYSTFEKPTLAEGFNEVWHIDENNNITKEVKV